MNPSKNWHGCWSKSTHRDFLEELAMMTKGRYLIGAAAGLAVGALLMLFAGSWSASAQGVRQNASNTLVTCEPSQQVVVRHTIVNGELQVATQCVGAAAGIAPARYQDDGYVSARPINLTRTVAAPVSTVAAAPVRRAGTAERTGSGRSWKKTALVIGGSAGAGAGVGAIAGGKKGALIGAAIGGGAASIYEAIKR
jgi:hypothetical protein